MWDINTSLSKETIAKSLKLSSLSFTGLFAFFAYGRELYVIIKSKMLENLKIMNTWRSAWPSNISKVYDIVIVY